MLNSTISDAPNSVRFLHADLKDLFVDSFMKHPESMYIPLSTFPTKTIERYNLNNIICSEGFIYIRRKKGMDWIKQTVTHAYAQLVKYLQPFGYAPISFSLRLWTHTLYRATFCLCIDDVGIRYFSKDNALHLFNALKQGYPTSIDS